MDKITGSCHPLYYVAVLVCELFQVTCKANQQWAYVELSSLDLHFTVGYHPPPYEFDGISVQKFSYSPIPRTIMDSYHWSDEEIIYAFN